MPQGINAIPLRSGLVLQQSATQANETFAVKNVAQINPHTIEMALQYEIHCPECNQGILKQVGRCLNSNELGLYVCPVCDKHRTHR